MPQSKKEIYKRWYGRHREKKIEQSKDYYRSHRETLIARNVDRRRKKKQSDPEYRKRENKKIDHRRKGAMKKARAILGNQCFICKHLGKQPPKQRIKTSIFRFHEKNGEKHTSDAYLYLRYPERFVLLCFRHHEAVHFCQDQLHMSWKEIEDKLLGDNKHE